MLKRWFILTVKLLQMFYFCICDFMNETKVLLLILLISGKQGEIKIDRQINENQQFNLMKLLYFCVGKDFYKTIQNRPKASSQIQLLQRINKLLDKMSGGLRGDYWFQG